MAIINSNTFANSQLKKEVRCSFPLFLSFSAISHLTINYSFEWALKVLRYKARMMNMLQQLVQNGTQTRHRDVYTQTLLLQEVLGSGRVTGQHPHQ